MYRRLGMTMISELIHVLSVKDDHDTELIHVLSVKDSPLFVPVNKG